MINIWIIPEIVDQQLCIQPGENSEEKTNCNFHSNCSLWTAWGVWSKCHRSCAPGFRRRERKCNRNNEDGKYKIALAKYLPVQFNWWLRNTIKYMTRQAQVVRNLSCRRCSSNRSNQIKFHILAWPMWMATMKLTLFQLSTIVDNDFVRKLNKRGGILSSP